MKYIPGYCFTVGENIRAGGSILQQRDMKSKIAKVGKNFTVGQTYKIFYITPNKDGIVYTFIDNTNNRFEEKFNNQEDAESKIDFLRGS